MLAIRLTRFGKTHRPFYRIIIKEKRSKRDGKYIDRIGYYDPFTKETKIDIDKYDYWLKRGAQPSETVKNLIKKFKQTRNPLT